MVKHIKYKDEVVAIFTPHDHVVEGAEFITSPDSSLQVGLLQRQAGSEAKPHYHLYPPTVIKELHEVIFVIRGKVLMTIYDQDSGAVIAEFPMVAGDSIVHMRQAHGVKFLEESLIFEVKQGPYPGDKMAKVFLDD